MAMTSHRRPLAPKPRILKEGDQPRRTSTRTGVPPKTTSTYKDLVNELWRTRQTRNLIRMLFTNKSRNYKEL